MFGLTLIAMLAVMGGLIAYIGDKIGMKVGRKKLTLFGLRPKYTSIIITIITGIVISAATLATLSVVSWDVRTALFGMEALKQDLAFLSGEVDEKNRQLDANRKQYELLSAKIAAGEAELAKVQGDLAQTRDQYLAAEQDLLKSREEILSLQAARNELEGKIKELTQARDKLKTDVDRLEELTNKLRSGLEWLREGVVVFRNNEVLATGVVRGKRPPADVQRDLLQLVIDTNADLLRRLGKPGTKAEMLWINKAEFEEVVTRIAATPGEMVVRILSEGNTVYGEPVIGRFEIFPNKLIYPEGTVVTKSLVDLTGEPQAAEEKLLRFLQEVNAAAVSKGMLPDPLQGTVGTITGAELFNTVNYMKKLGGKLELTAVTTTDTWTAGPLKIKIHVTRVYE